MSDNFFKLNNKPSSFEFFEEFFENFQSEHTRISYKNDITRFLDFLADTGPKIKSYGKIERFHIIKYRNWLQEAGGRHGEQSAPKTVARKLASISSYFNFLIEKGMMEFNPATSVKRPRREVATPTNALTGKQVRELLNTIDENKHSGKLHKAIIMMFFTTGLRKSEILNLHRRNYRIINGHKMIEFRGKGGKLGQKLLHPESIEALENYLLWMKEQGREHIPQDWLFQPTRNPTDPKNINKPLNPKTINEILDSYARKTGLPFKISPHSARATFIGELLEAGVDIYSVAQEVNHSSVKTTEEYDKRKRKLTDSPVYKLNF